MGKSPFQARPRHGCMNRFSDMGLATKLTIVVYSSFVIIFLFLTALMILSSQKNNEDEMRRQGQSFLQNGMSLLLEEMQYINGIAESIGLAKDIQTMMNNNNSGTDLPVLSDTLSVVQKQRYVVSIVVYNRSGYVLDYFSIDGSSGPVAQSVENPLHPLFKLMNENKAYEWQYLPCNSHSFMLNDNSPKLCLWRRVLSTKTMDVIGSVAVCIDVRKLIDAGPRPGSAYQSIIIINDKNEEVFNKTGLSLDPSIIANLNSLNYSTYSGADSIQIGNTLYLVFSARVANTSFRLLHLVPNKISWVISGLNVYIISAVALFIMLLLPLYNYLSKSITKPLKKLILSMDSFSQGHSTQQVRFHHQDEVGILGCVFDSMLSENKKLINSNYILKLKEKEAALESLQSQMKPHFLYNVLNSIQWLALKSHNNEVADLIYSLGKMFQLSMNAKTGMTSIGQEIDMIQNYLKLQKKCRQRHFDYTVSIAEKADEVSIPRFCIQPIVENSIVHGVENCYRKVLISIRVFFSDDKQSLTIVVSDNGPGISPELLRFLPDHLSDAGLDKSKDSNRLAIKNIYERLVLLYENHFDFNITSVPYVKTTTSITIPSNFNNNINLERLNNNVQDSPN